MDILSDPKAMASLQSALVFLIVANPAAYRLTNSMLGFVLKVSNTNSGSPTVFGLVLHAVVFGLIAYALMSIKRPIPEAVIDQVRSWTGDVIPADGAIAKDVVKADREIAEAVMRKEELRTKNTKKIVKKAAEKEVKQANDKRQVVMKKMASSAGLKVAKKKEGFLSF